MVSKVAVIALVVIVACPILLGYGMNLTQVTETDYRSENDPVNVTQLLNTGIGYNYARGDIYTNNTNFSLEDQAMFIMPIYNDVASQRSPLPMNQIHYGPGTPFNLHLTFAQYSDIFTYLLADYVGGLGYMKMEIYNTSNVLQLQVNFIHTVFYDTATSTVYYSYYPGGDLSNLNTSGRYTVTDTNYSLHFDEVGGSGSDVYLDLARSAANVYVNFAAGFYFQTVDNKWNIKFPSRTKSVLLSVDLDSVTAANYSVKYTFQGVEYVLTKTTVAGEVNWQVQNNNYGWTQDLYYDKDGSNTYQIYFDFFMTKEVSGTYYYESNAEFRYIGGWKTIIGEANYYQKYTNKIEITSNDDTIYNLTYLTVSDATGHISPTMRVDYTEFRAFEYNVIEDKTYYPSNFRSNPTTKITDITKYGTSLTFGGETYTVSNGKITIGSQSIPVEKLTFSSIPNSNYGFDNKIGNTFISESAAPSEIVFNGEWSASVATDSLESYTITKTKLDAGSFAWNGMDQNFIMAGLLASLGAFIGVGIYARRTKATVWPLLIVCGGAALLFFLML